MAAPYFIAISGKAGGGKDTIKDAIIDYFRERGKISSPFSFAGPLKDACVLWFGWDRQRLDSDYPYKEGGLGNTNPDDVDPYCVALGLTRRQVMQKLGTECMRDGMHRNFWIILADLALKTGKLAGFDIGLVTDARFLNELDWVKSINGYTIKVERTVCELGETPEDAIKRFASNRSADSLTKSTNHASELEFETWGHFDRIVINLIDKNLSESESKKKFHDFIVQMMPEIEEKFTA